MGPPKHLAASVDSTLKNERDGLVHKDWFMGCQRASGFLWSMAQVLWGVDHSARKLRTWSTDKSKAVKAKQVDLGAVQTTILPHPCACSACWNICLSFMTGARECEDETCPECSVDASGLDTPYLGIWYVEHVSKEWIVGTIYNNILCYYHDSNYINYIFCISFIFLICLIYYMLDTLP